MNKKINSMKKMPTMDLKKLIQQVLAGVPWQTKLQPTLSVEHVPYVLHEPAILSGYRLLHRPWKYYLFSLFQFHNETVNVWTHLIGCFIILHKMYGYVNEFTFNVDHVLTTLLLFGTTCIVGLFTSAMVHLLHSKSCYIHFVAFMTDYIGATICSFGSGISGIYGSSDEAFYHVMEPFYITLLFVSSYLNFVNLCVAKLWYGHDPHNLNRKYMFIIGMGMQATINAAPFLPRYSDCFYDDQCSIASLNYLTAIQIIFVLEALAFAAHQPEKKWPGKFDIVGHGHQIFHVLIVINHVLQLDCMYNDHVSGIIDHSKPNGMLVLVTMVTLYVAKGITLWYLTRQVPGCLRRVKRAVAKAEHEAERLAHDSKKE
ncbi:membrane progestin receptor beta-like [Mya arenaria]|uniref:membrane progestin receptor beta-like n=1 Tax=Mya arenaria TaxID=6604 RepID=UPI0022E4972D|nr:membrane progestin receptor beta-like [Mya arenaria]